MTLLLIETFVEEAKHKMSRKTRGQQIARFRIIRLTPETEGGNILMGEIPPASD